MKHYRLNGLSKASAPHLLFEVSFDIRDLRSGYKQSTSAFYRTDYREGDDVSWGRDVVERVEAEDLKPCDPPREVLWPAGVDEKMVQYAVSHVRFPIWRHAVLGMYSRAGETRREFVERCREALAEELAARLRRVRKIFAPRFLEAERRWIEQTEEEDWDEENRAGRLSEMEGFFAELNEEMARLLLRDESFDLPEDILETRSPLHPELVQQLGDLRAEFFSQYNQVIDSFERSASQIEEYEVAPQWNQVEIVSRGILWD